MFFVLFLCLLFDRLGVLLLWTSYRKNPKISPGLIFLKGPFCGAYFWRGLSTKGNLRFKIDWARLIVGRKFTVLALFY